MQDFLRAKGVAYGCHRCGKSTGWNVGESEQGRGLALFMLGQDGETTETLYPLLPLSCVNCGNMWLINRLTIENWVREQKKERSGSEEHP